MRNQNVVLYRTFDPIAASWTMLGVLFRSIYFGHIILGISCAMFEFGITQGRVFIHCTNNSPWYFEWRASEMFKTISVLAGA
jgi:hypothetical protein